MNPLPGLITQPWAGIVPGVAGARCDASALAALGGQDVGVTGVSAGLRAG
jgi:hypothetical protein